MPDPDLPQTIKELVELLDKETPLRLQRINESDREYQRYVGRRELVDELVELWRVQSDPRSV